MNKEIEKVKLDFEKLSAAVKAQKISQKVLAVRLGHHANWVADLKKKDSAVTTNVERFICMELGLEPGSLIRKEPEQEVKRKGDDDKTLKLLGEICKQQYNIVKVLDNVVRQLDGLADQSEATWNKLNTQATQLMKIKEKLGELGTTGYQKAIMFLKDALSNGQMLETEIVAKGEEAGIVKADLYKAKRDLHVQVAVTGYGKNQKTWWLLSE